MTFVDANRSELRSLGRSYERLREDGTPKTKPSGAERKSDRRRMNSAAKRSRKKNR